MEDKRPYLPLETVLAAVGDLLEAQGATASIIVVGGASLILQGVVERGTADVDVMARVETHDDERRVVPPDPFPTALSEAVVVVARDFGLDVQWMNTMVARKWVTGLPPLSEREIEWRRFGGLEVGLSGRRTLIALKLFAAVDADPRSKHTQDLIALMPSDSELEEAAAWVRTQDAQPAVSSMIREVVTYVQRSRS